MLLNNVNECQFYRHHSLSDQSTQSHRCSYPNFAEQKFETLRFNHPRQDWSTYRQLCRDWICIQDHIVREKKKTPRPLLCVILLSTKIGCSMLLRGKKEWENEGKERGRKEMQREKVGRGREIKRWITHRISRRRKWLSPHSPLNRFLIILVLHGHSLRKTYGKLK